jgi:hypothetical protein
MGGLTSLLCLFGPVFALSILGLIGLILYSGYKWLTDRDLLAAFREPPNEFDVDDAAALESAVEATVRESLDAVGIPRTLMPPAVSSSFRQRAI